MQYNVGLKDKMNHRLRSLVTLVVAYFLWQTAVITTSPIFMAVLAGAVAVKGVWLLAMSDASHRKLMNWAGSFSPLAVRFLGVLAVLLAWYLYSVV